MKYTWGFNQKLVHQNKIEFRYQKPVINRKIE